MSADDHYDFICDLVGGDLVRVVVLIVSIAPQNLRFRFVIQFPPSAFSSEKVPTKLPNHNN